MTIRSVDQVHIESQGLVMTRHHHIFGLDVSSCARYIHQRMDSEERYARHRLRQGGILFLLGLVLTLILFLPGGKTFSLLGPVFLVLGLMLVVGEAAPRAVLLIGLVMLAIGGFPWAYTPWLMGTRGGDEGSGMMGTLIFICVGMPGLAATLVGLFYTFSGSD